MRYFFLLLLIVASIAVFSTKVLPHYRSLGTTRAEVAVYQSNLDTAKKLTASRESLITTYRAISKENLDNLKILLPDNVNNIRLIIQIDELAKKNGLSVLKSIDYQVIQEKDGAANSTQNPDIGRAPYGEFVMSFQTTGEYKNFLSFMSDLEQNLRLVDITKVDFATTDSSTAQSGLGSPTYKVTLKTYWLKQ